MSLQWGHPHVSDKLLCTAPYVLIWCVTEVLLQLNTRRQDRLTMCCIHLRVHSSRVCSVLYDALALQPPLLCSSLTSPRRNWWM